MSLILNDTSFSNSNMCEDGSDQNQTDMNKLDTYLSIIENNKKSSRFVPDDALMALDMAGFVRGCLTGKPSGSPVSAARLALALAQPCRMAPVQ